MLKGEVLIDMCIHSKLCRGQKDQHRLNIYHRGILERPLGRGVIDIRI